MKMTPDQQLAVKKTLHVLNTIGAGLPADTAFDEAERATGQTIQPDDRKYLLALMEQEGWIDKHVDDFSGRIIHFITANPITVPSEFATRSVNSRWNQLLCMKLSYANHQRDGNHHHEPELVD